MRMKKKSVIRAGMSDEKFYTRDFPNVKVGQVKVAPHRGDYTVFIGLSDGTIAYQWCESKAVAQREAEYARGIVKKYGSDAPYWVEEGYKIWNPNVKSTSAMSRRRRSIRAGKAPFDIPNILESLKRDYESGEITLEEAAKELYSANWIPRMNDLEKTKRLLGIKSSVKCSSRRRSIKAASDSGVMIKTETAEGTYYLAKSATKKKTFWTESYDSANKFAKKDSAVSKLYSVLSRLEDNAFYDPDDMYDIESEADLKKAKFAKFYITDLSGKTIEDISTEVKNHMLADDAFVSAVLDDFDNEDDIEESTRIRGRRSVKCSTRRIRASKERPYLYVLKHGLGPGTLPRDVEIIKTDEYNGYTLVWLDRFLTTSELKEYDIPSESNLERYLGEDFDRFSGVFSSRKVGRYIKASVYDIGDIVMFYNGKEIYRGLAGGYMYDAVYDICKDDSTRLKIQEWCNQFGDSLFDDEFDDADATTYTFCSLVYDLLDDGEDYLDGEGILNFEIFPESDEAELFGDYKYGDIESSTVLSARDNTVDETAVRKMVEAIVNDYELYPTALSIIKNMQRKIKRGKYNADLAVKAWQYLADEGVAKYYKTKGALNPETRKAIAVGLRDNYEEEVNEGVEASEGLVTI